MNEFPENIHSTSTTHVTSVSPVGKLLLGLTGGIAVGLSVLCVPFISPALRKYCLPYIPATNAQVKNIFIALKNRKGSFLDLGSGDGRIVFEAAKRDFDSYGVELNLWLVLYCKVQAHLKKLHHKTNFYRKDLWKFNISNFDNVIIFGVDQM